MEQLLKKKVIMDGNGHPISVGFTKKGNKKNKSSNHLNKNMMKITKRTVTNTFQESIENYRFNGSYTEEDNKVVSVNANVDLVIDEQTGEIENLGYINLKKSKGKDVKTICEELVNGVNNLIRTLVENEN